MAPPTGLPLVVAVRGCARAHAPGLRHAPRCAGSDASLPALAQVDCLAERASAVRAALGGCASLVGTGAGWGNGGAPVELLSTAAVVLARSLHELSPTALGYLRGAPAVVLLSPWEGATEEALGAELGVLRVVRAAPPAADERADTALALLLALLRRTHSLARQVATGAWLPPPQAYRGARRAKGMRLGLLGLDAAAPGLARRAAACGFRVAYAIPPPPQPKPTPADAADPATPPAPIAEPPPEQAALVAEAEAAGAVRATSVEALLSAVDALSLHCAGSAPPALDASRLALLPRGAFLVHVGGPAALDAHAVKRALLSGALAGAALDSPDGDAWLEAWARDAPNLILTPRGAGRSEEADEQAVQLAAQAAKQEVQRLRDEAAKQAADAEAEAEAKVKALKL